MRNCVITGEVVERLPGGLYSVKFPGEPDGVTHEVPACAGQVWTPQTRLPVDITDPQRMHILASGSAMRKMRYIPVVTGAWPQFGFSEARRRGRTSDLPADWALDSGWSIAHALSSGGAVMSTSVLVHTYATGDHKLRAWSLTDGAEVWARDIGYGGGHVISGTIYGTSWIGWANGNLTCVAMGNGTITWQQALTDQAYSFAFDSGVGYYIQTPAIVSSFAPGDGAVGWSTDIQATIASAAIPGSGDSLLCGLILVGGVLMVRVTASNNAYVVGLDPADGTVLWTRALKGTSASASFPGAWTSIGGDRVMAPTALLDGGGVRSDVLSVVGTDGTLIAQTALPKYSANGVIASSPDDSWGLVVGTLLDPDTGDIGMYAFDAAGDEVWSRLENWGDRPEYKAVIYVGTTAVCLADTTFPSNRIQLDEYASGSSTAADTHEVTGTLSDFESLAPMVYDAKIYYQDTSGYMQRVV